MLSGCEYSVRLITSKANFESVETNFVFKTLLTPIQFTLIESAPGVLKLQWDTSYDGLQFDKPKIFLEISFKFVRAENISKTLNSDCLLNGKANLTDLSQTEIKFYNVCCLRTYDIAIKTFKEEFEPAESYRTVYTSNFVSFLKFFHILI